MGNSHAIWDHTVLPATRQRWESRLYPELKQVLDLTTLEGCKAELSCHTWILLLCYWQTGDYVASTDLGSAYNQTSGSDLSASGKTLHCIVSIFLNKTGVKWELLDTVKARKLAYCGHTMRKQGSCLKKEIMHGTMPGAHRRGRPRTAWMDNISRLPAFIRSLSMTSFPPSAGCWIRVAPPTHFQHLSWSSLLIWLLRFWRSCSIACFQQPRCRKCSNRRSSRHCSRSQTLTLPSTVIPSDFQFIGGV